MNLHKLSFLSMLCGILICNDVMASYTWIQKQSMPIGGRRDATSFSIGTTHYVGTGRIASNTQADFWAYDELSGVWTQVANITNVRLSACGFSDGVKGYVGLGYLSSPSTFYNDLQEYDPITNTWIYKASLPAPGRYGTSVFVTGGIAYLVGGNLGSATGPYSDQLWAYNMSTDSWQQKSSFPGGAKYNICSFSINNVGYSGSGGIKTTSGPYLYYDEFYSYNPATDTWNSINDFPGGRQSGMNAVVYNMKAFVGGGVDSIAGFYNTFYIYDPVTAQWSAGPSLPLGMERSHWRPLASALRSFLSTGVGFGGTQFNDLWELVETTNVEELHLDESSSFYYSGDAIIFKHELKDNTHIKILNSAGQVIRYENRNSFIAVSDLPKGIYLACYYSGDHLVTSQKVAIR